MVKQPRPTVWRRWIVSHLVAIGVLLGVSSMDAQAATASKSGTRGLSKVTSDQVNEFAKRGHDVGRFHLPISNYGVHGQHETAVGSGGEWPNGSRDYYIFGAGIWISGKIDGDPRCAVGYNPNSADFEMYPGTLPNNTGEVGPDEILYMSTDGEDRSNWPLRDAEGQPALVSIQDSYAIYNDMNADWTFSTEKPLGLQVIQQGYAWNYSTNQDVVFLTFDITNITNDPNYAAAAAAFKGDAPAPNTTITDVFMGPCVDPDIGGATDDMLDFDPGRNLGITWDFDGTEADFDLDLNGDGEIGDTGVLGYDFLESPIADRDVDLNGDGVVNDDSVNFGTDDAPIWVKDVRQGEQLGLTAFKIFTLQIDPRTDQNRYDMMSGYDYRTMEAGGDSVYSPFDLDTAPEDKRFVQCTGPFDLAPGDTARVVVAVMVAANREELGRMSDLAQAIYDNDYFLPFPPKSPQLSAVEGDREVILLWDDSAEQAADPFGEVAADPTSVFFDPAYEPFDFQGYRVYRSLTGVSGSWEMLGQYDLNDGYTVRVDTFVYTDGTNWPREVQIGNDTGLKHRFVDNSVRNGMSYFYSVTAYDFQPKATPITLESAFTNQIVAVPRSHEAGYRPPEIGAIEHVAGPSDGSVEAQLIDPTSITGHDYEIFFTDTMIAPIDPSKLGDSKFWHVRDVNLGKTVATNLSHFDEYGIGGGDAIPIDGLVFQVNDVALQSTVMTHVRATDTLRTINVFPYKLTNPEMNGDFRDFEVRFTGWTNESGDTVNYGLEIAHPTAAEYVKKACPFEFWDIGFWKDEDADGVDDIPDDDVRLWPIWSRIGDAGFFLDKNTNGTKYEEDFFSNPAHSSADYWNFNFQDPNSRSDWDYTFIGLKAATDLADTSWATGDVWRLVNTYPILTGENGDRWRISTQSLAVEALQSSLDEIKVVPNPFLIANDFMRDPAFKEVHFTHLPNQCTIRIFNTAGDLIDIIDHDVSEGDGGDTIWDLTSRNRQLITSGVYVYHVEAPGVGNKVGTFAVIIR